MAITIKDVIQDCELAYELNNRQPSAIKEAATRLLEKHDFPNNSHPEQLLRSILDAASPRIFLNAASLKLRYLEQGTFVEEHA